MAQGQFTCPELVKSQGSPHGTGRVGSKINAWMMEQSKKLWGALNHRTY